MGLIKILTAHKAIFFKRVFQGRIQVFHEGGGEGEGGGGRGECSESLILAPWIKFEECQFGAPEVSSLKPLLVLEWQGRIQDFY